MACPDEQAARRQRAGARPVDNRVGGVIEFALVGPLVLPPLTPVCVTRPLGGVTRPLGGVDVEGRGGSRRLTKLYQQQPNVTLSYLY